MNLTMSRRFFLTLPLLLTLAVPASRSAHAAPPAGVVAPKPLYRDPMHDPRARQ